MQDLAQLPLSLRIPTLANAVRACRDRQKQLETEEATYMDLLAQAEAAVVGKAPGYEGVELSGLIPTDQNPHIPTAPPPSEEQGDTHQGKAGGDPSPAGSGSSPAHHSQHRRK